MFNIKLDKTPSKQEKVEMMAGSAAFDVGDSDRIAQGDYSAHFTETECAGRKSSPVAVVSTSTAPKVFLSNDCSFNCQYCESRQSREGKRPYCFEPRELAEISVDIARKNNNSVLISSAVYKNAHYTQELIIETMKKMRHDLGYKGYIHAKVMPGADSRLIKEAGMFADRLSVNIELPHSDGYKEIAKQKNRNNILGPMEDISELVKENRADRTGYVKSGQTTQLIVGAMEEDDRTILKLSQALYGKYDLRRVYYSPFYPIQETSFLPLNPTPRWRGRRLYQADRLMQLYGMTADEITPAESSFLDFDIDPKAAWALRNLHLFPVEVNSVDYETLIRVPGIGTVGAQKITEARRQVNLTHENLRKIGISLKQSIYFITCNGKYHGGKLLGSPFLRANLCQDTFSRHGGMEQMRFDGLDN